MNPAPAIYAHIVDVALSDGYKLTSASTNPRPTGGATDPFSGRPSLTVTIEEGPSLPCDYRPHNPCPELTTDPYEGQRLLLRRWLVGADRDGRRLPVVCPAAGVRSGYGVALEVRWAHEGELLAPVFVHLVLTAR